ncbi:MAG: ABC transporter substrate-binding protein [Lachnospiraceae bacterium]|nr:ABC transporter substrate-binding protein [Lachnospiraceae bacterium]
MKKLYLRMMTGLVLLGLAACGAEGEDRPEQDPAGQALAEQPLTGQTEYTFTDDLGREVTVSSHERVAALLGSYADMWILAGGSICAAPDDAFEDLDLPLAEDTVNLGRIRKLNLELLLSSEPDFVLASTNTPEHLEWQQAMEGAGITVAYFDVACFEDYLRMLKICTDITGQPELYEEYGTGIQKQIQEILDRRGQEAPQTVLVMRASAGSIRAKGNEGNVLGEMLDSFGCVNIADSDESLLENLSLESIVLSNPDKIFFVQTGDDIEGTQKNVETTFGENPLWNELDAVKNNEVYFLDKNLFNLKPNARWGEAYEVLEEILYGE